MGDATRGVSGSVKALWACVAVALAALAATVESARACSCVQPDPWTIFPQADGAFVGSLVSRRETDQGRVVLTFSVERRVKGQMGSTVEVTTANNGAACGIEAPTGRRIGLFLLREGGRWVGHLCWVVEPEDLLAAATLPAPNGRGSVAMFVGGRFGAARTLALDAKGRTLAYGTGAGRSGLLSPCPGGERLAEIAFLSPEPYRAELAIRDARTLGVITRRPLRLPGPRRAHELLCEDKLGSRVLLFAGPPGDAPNDKALLRLAGERLTAIWHGDAHDAELGSTVVYLSAGMSGRRLLAVDRTGRGSRIADLPGAVDSLRRHPAGRYLVGVDFRPAGRSLIVLVDLRRSPVEVRTAFLANGAYGDVAWLTGGRFLFFPSEGRDTGRVFDLRLQNSARFRWTADDATLVGSTAFGIDYRTGRLVSAKVPTGPQRKARRLPGTPEVIVSARR